MAALTFEDYFSKLDEDIIPEIRTLPVTQEFMRFIASYTTGADGLNNQSFKDLFFPNSGAQALNDAVKQIINTDDSTLHRWNKALLTQRLCMDNSSLMGNVHYDQVCAVVTEMSNAFRNHAAELFVNSLKEELKGNQDITAEKYKNALLSSSWRNMTAAKQASASYPNETWKTYCHFAKYKAAGACDSDISDVYRLLTTTSPKLSLTLTSQDWKNYTAWCYADLDGSMMNMSNTTSSFKHESSYPSPCGVVIATTEILYAHSYVSGTPWFYEPSSSCLSGDTGVLSTDGSFIPVSQLQPGDMVQTPQGQRRCAFVSQTYRNDRTLYNISGTNAWFTADHPICLEAGAVGFVHPDLAMERIFTFKHFTVKKLDEDSILLSYMPSKECVPFKLGSLAASKESKKDELLYDVILDMEEGDSSQYLIGGPEFAFCVMSELPEFGRYPLTEWLIRQVLALAATSSAKECIFDLSMAGKGANACYTVYQWLKQAVERASLEPCVLMDNYLTEQELLTDTNKLSDIMMKETEFSKELGIISDALIANAQMIHGDLEMGYRIFEHEQGPWMGISLYQADVDIGTRFYMICEDTVCTKSEYYHFSVCCDNIQLYGSLSVPAQIDCRYFQSVHLYDETCKRCGRVWVCVRFLSDDARILERQRKSEWNSVRKHQFAKKVIEAGLSDY